MFSPSQLRPNKLSGLIIRGLELIRAIPTQPPQSTQSHNDDAEDMSYYAVQKGRNPGIYRSWFGIILGTLLQEPSLNLHFFGGGETYRGDCAREVTEFSGAKYKKFATKEEAQEFVSGGRVSDRMYPSSSSSSSSSSWSSPYSGGAGGGGAAGGKSSGYGGGWNSYGKQSSSSGLYSPPPRLTPLVDSSGEPAAVVYTDGSSLGNGANGARAGVGVYWGPNDPRFYSPFFAFVSASSLISS